MSEAPTSFSRKNPRRMGARSKVSHQYGNIVSKSPSKIQPVDQEPEPRQEENQEPLTVGARLSSCFPNSTNALVFFLFVVIYLVCATIHFVHTDDGGMLVTLLPYLAGYVGIPMVTPHIPWGKNKGE